MKKSLWLGSTMLFVLSLASLLQAVPQVISFQGRLTTATGTPVTDGSYSVVFNIYDAPVGGASKWAETQTVTTSAGLFAVVLGIGSPISDSVFSGAERYLGTKVGADPELVPRVRLGSVPYSFRSQGADTATQALNIPDNSVSSVKIIDGSIQLVDLAASGASDGQVIKWNGAAWVPADDSAGQGDVTGITVGPMLTGGGTEGTIDIKADTAAMSAYYSRIGHGHVVVDSAINVRTNAIDSSHIRTGSITTDDLKNSTILFGDIAQNGASSGQVMKWNGSVWVAANDSVGTGGGAYLPLAGGTMTGAIANTGDPSISMGKGSFGSGNLNTGLWAFVAGANNRARGNYSTVSGGGGPNPFDSSAALGLSSTVGGGKSNIAAGEGATIAGGQQNRAGSDFSTIGGGYGNVAGLNATAAGGNQNVASGAESFVGGGFRDSALGTSSVVVGGYRNTASYGSSTIVGGSFGQTTGDNAFIGGGYLSEAGQYAVVGGGWKNKAQGPYAMVAGGYENLARGYNSTVAGGEYNVADTLDAAVLGGRNNKARGEYSVVLGGGGWATADSNVARGAASLIGAGRMNTTRDSNTVVCGGMLNKADSAHSAVVGGKANVALGRYAFVGGGMNDSAGYCATVSGGYLNAALNEYSTASGGLGNRAIDIGATVAGGSRNIAVAMHAVVGGGSDDSAQGQNSCVGGGANNKAIGFVSTIAGGAYNRAYGDYSAIVGGRLNYAGTKAVCSGGEYDTASGDFASVPGGSGNAAAGKYSFAAGQQAKAVHDGSFVWADYSSTNLNSERNNQVRMRAAGGTRFDVNLSGWVNIYNDGAGSLITTSTGARLTTGGVWTNASDRRLKENFSEVNGQQILTSLRKLPITQWNYRSEKIQTKHIGPTAQDFYTAFGLGSDTVSISTIDPSGVALVAIKELIKQNDELRTRVEQLSAEVATLKKK